MMRRLRLRRPREQRGTSTLEFIVVLPFLLFVLFAIFEVSRAWLTLNMATAAAREGVRAAVVAAPDQAVAAGMARISAVVSDPGMTASVTCSTSPCAPDAIVTARVTIPFSTVVPSFLPSVFHSMAITQTATMRFE